MEKREWWKTKQQSFNCRCRRRGRNVGPKVTASLCHFAAGGYHPSAVERIRGKRLARAWLHELRGGDVDDVEL